MEQTKNFMCIVFGMDFFGRPVRESAQATVTRRNLDVSVVLRKVNKVGGHQNAATAVIND